MAQLRHAFALVLVLLSGSIATQAHAQAGAAASEALFRAGREAMQQGDATTARAKFRESYRLEQALGTLLNIAVCEEALGELGNAWQHYQEVIHALPANDDRVAIARQHLQELEPRLPRLTVQRVAGAPEDTRVSIGGIELEGASFDIALPMDPGHYDVSVNAPGRKPRSFSVELKEGDHAVLEVEPGESMPPPNPYAAAPSVAGQPAQPANTEMSELPPTSRAPATFGGATDTRRGSGPGTRTVVAYAMLGAGGASLLVAAVSGAFVLDRAATVHDHCPKGRCDVDGLAAARSGQTLYLVSLTTLGVGLASVGSALYLLLSHKSPDRDVAVQPLLSPTTLGLGVQGRI